MTWMRTTAKSYCAASIIFKRIEIKTANSFSTSVNNGSFIALIHILRHFQERWVAFNAGLQLDAWNHRFRQQPSRPLLGDTFLPKGTIRQTWLLHFNSHYVISQCSSGKFASALWRSDKEPGYVYIITSTDDDILIGRGRSVQYNPNNIHFRMLAVSKTEVYDTTPRHWRQEIVSEVARGPNSEGVRFLQQIDADVWVRCNEKENNAIVQRVS